MSAVDALLNKFGRERRQSAVVAVGPAVLDGNVPPFNEATPLSQASLIRVPVIAAGGIADGRVIAAAFALGADRLDIAAETSDKVPISITSVGRFVGRPAKVSEPDELVFRRT